MDFKGKRILFFSVAFFNYELTIANKLRELGAEVHYYDERPSNSVLTKGLIRLNPAYLKSRISSYYAAIAKEVEEVGFDYIFIIKGEVIPLETLRQLKLTNPNAKVILYLWDSFLNNDNAKNLLSAIDQIYSFNASDCAEHNFVFRPLFFLDVYAEIRNHVVSNEFDLVFICTAHTDRYQLGKRIEAMLDENGLRMYGYYYLQSTAVFIYKYLFEKEFRDVNYKDIQSVSLDTNQIVELYGRSGAVLDVHHPKQEGLTMRTIETVGASKKLITTNANIENYDFYNENNILIIDRDDPVVNLSFFDTPYQPIDDEILAYYSIEGWLKTIFSES